tara:strand:+ start:184 stop:348 length:165 start_codon:yes stop_codon:yes gene_type:complete
MFGIDMAIWNRVTYPERKTVLKTVSNTGAVVVIAGCFAVVVAWPVTKLVELFAA